MADPWHWQEKDLTRWMNTALSEHFCRREVVSTAEGMVSTTTARVGDGEAVLNTRKGKQFVVASLEIVIKFTAKALLNGAVICSVDGDVSFTSVGEAGEAEDWPVRVRVGAERPGPGAPSGALSCELNATERKMKEFVTAEAITPMRKALERMLVSMTDNALKKDARETGDPNAASTDSSAEQGEGAGAAADGNDGPHEETQTTGHLLPKRFVEALEAIRGGDDAFKSAILSCCQLKDDHVASLAAALSTSGYLEEMDLSYNDITDVGVQTLVTAIASNAAGMKALSSIKLSNNPKITAIGKSMLNGLSLMRKSLVIES